MERIAAVKKLTKLLGKSMGYQVNLKAPDEDDRAEARAELKLAMPIRDALGKALDARRQELMQGDAEYQRLKGEYKAARERCDKLSGISHSYRFTAGTSNGIFFHVKAQGDSWEEVIKKLTTKETV